MQNFPMYFTVFLFPMILLCVNYWVTFASNAVCICGLKAEGQLSAYQAAAAGVLLWL